MSEPCLTDRTLYLRRLGFDAPPAPTLETLRQLQLRHTGVFPVSYTHLTLPTNREV